jgi:hypothetical protein
MGFNLGAFAGGLVSGGLKTYTTLKEQERLDTIEARDKTRFEEEQRLIAERQAAQEIARKAAIPTAADQPGIGVDRVVEAIPRAALYAGNEKGVVGFSDAEVAASEQAFRSTVKGLTPEQQALVLRGYGDQSNAAGQAFEKGQRAATEGKYGIPEGLNAAVVREDAGGGRSVVTADTDEKKTVARYKAMAMASGNPVAIKASHEAEATMLNREVAQQTLKLGEQNIAMNVFKLSEAQSVADFTKRFNDNLVAAKTENSKLLKEVDEATNDPKATVESLLKQFGVQIKDGTGQSYYAKDGKVYTKDAGGNETVVADSLDQAKVLLKQGAGAHFAHDLSNRIVKEGLFKSPEAFNEFYKAEREWVTASANIANTRVMAAAATKNATSAATTADAAKKKADTDAAEFEAKKNAGTYKATADALVAQAAASRSHGEYYASLSKRANEDAALTASTRAEVKTILQEYEKLTPAQQKGPEGEAILTRATLLYAKKSGDISGLITAMKRPDGMEAKPISPADVAKFVESFGGTASSFKDGNGNAIPIGKLSPAQVMQEMQGMMGGAAPVGSGLPSNTPAPAGGPPKAADAAPKAAIPPYVPPAGSPAAVELEKRKAAADAKDQATKTLRDTATAAATAAISASSQVDARKVQQMDGFSLLPVAVQAQIYQIVNKPVSAIPAAKASAPAAPAAAAIPTAAAAPAALTGEDKSAELRRKREESAAAALAAVERRKREESAAAVVAKDKAAPAEKSIAAREEDLGYKVAVAQSTYERRPGAITKAQLDSAQQELAAFRKANGIKP